EQRGPDTGGQCGQQGPREPGTLALHRVACADDTHHPSRSARLPLNGHTAINFRRPTQRTILGWISTRRAPTPTLPGRVHSPAAAPLDCAWTGASAGGGTLRRHKSAPTTLGLPCTPPSWSSTTRRVASSLKAATPKSTAFPARGE